ncbi:SDR family NAD(P)-dependent oxidoreductase [Bdellovibrionota bacterium FG-2]
MSNFHGKSVLITGASAGIGAALARLAAHQGAFVTLVARRDDRIKALAQEICAGGGRALAVAADVNRDGDLEAAVAAAIKEYGKLNVFIANAGFGVTGRLNELRLDDYRRQFETNVFGVLRSAYAGLESLKNSRGQFVILGSVMSYISPAESSAYSMSKFAVRALADSLTEEWREWGVGVTLVSPGLVKSEIRHVDNQGVLHSETEDRAPSWLVMPTEAAARHILRAVVKRRREYVVTLHGKVAVWLARFLPGVMRVIGRAI